MHRTFGKYLPLIGYLVLVAALALIFFRFEHDREDRARVLAAQTETRQTERVELTNQLCIESEKSREALRLQITATARLARSLVPAQAPELVAEVIKFQNEQLAALPPIVCEENGE